MGQALETSKRHFAAIREKRVDDIVAGYVDDPGAIVFVEGPRTLTRGWGNIAAGWRAFCASPITLETCEWTEVLQEEETEAMAWMSGTVAMNVDVKGRKARVSMRGTLVMKRGADGRLRIFHEHFSLPHADPYGIGDWLGKDAKE